MPDTHTRTQHTLGPMERRIAAIRNSIVLDDRWDHVVLAAIGADRQQAHLEAEFQRAWEQRNDLLAALEALTEAFATVEYAETQYADDFRMARTAIRKARGEE